MAFSVIAVQPARLSKRRIHVALRLSVTARVLSHDLIEYSSKIARRARRPKRGSGLHGVSIFAPSRGSSVLYLRVYYS